MNHPFLRAYMAGVVVPTGFLLVAMRAFSLARFVFNIPVPIERVIVFPMALIPNAFGAWNMLHVALTPDRRLSIVRSVHKGSEIGASQTRDESLDVLDEPSVVRGAEWRASGRCGVEPCRVATRARERSGLCWRGPAQAPARPARLFKTAHYRRCRFEPVPFDESL
jgi:hypothetical protein